MPRFPLLMLVIFAGTLFTSAMLLFLVQPMMGKMILPLLGGTPEVWNTCMVFFQAMLLAGYAYAHAVPAWLGIRRQAVLHLALLVVPFFFLPLSVQPYRGLITGGSAFPILQVLGLLFVTVGIPFFVISTSAPLLQKWFADTNHPAASDPYFLYGASNLGSMLALLGYPTLVEPFFGVPHQTAYWVVGYVLLVALMVGCATLLWLSPPAREPHPEVGEGAAPAYAPPPPTPEPPAGAIQKGNGLLEKRERGRKKKRGEKNAASTGIKPGPSTAIQKEPEPKPTASPVADSLGGPVTAWRRARWVLLSFVPSSLMLGATTYITTDIAAIPLLWVLPLALYLASFILVFAQITPRVQSGLVFGLLGALLLGVAFGMPGVTENPMILSVVWAGCILAGFFSLYILPLREPRLLHMSLVLALPLVALVIVFMMLTDIKIPQVGWHIGLHLMLLFIVAMICHGEMAHDRPSTKHLTEFFLWMSIGGVLGGLFNALFAPLAFYALAEYPFAIVLACMLLPPLIEEKYSKAALYADLSLLSAFVVVGSVLIVLGLLDPRTRPSFEKLKESPWGWHLIVLLLVLVGGALYVRRGRREQRVPRLLDVALPLTLAVLALGLLWGLQTRPVALRVLQVAKSLGLSLQQLQIMLAFGVPALLCYTFVERSLRFGLGVGALLLASGFNALLDRDVLLQTRSFFGVLRIEVEREEYELPLMFFGRIDLELSSRRLMHGTTMHGQQFTHPQLHGLPLTYYHRGGPVGPLMETYNERGRHMGVVGLGTGSMAAYGKSRVPGLAPGQRITFYDIDPTVEKIAFTTDKYFTFIADARQRGVQLDLVINDARLALEQPKLAPEDKYGILIVDAFSSDSIPIHLITREALQIYLDNLREDGILAFHVSNRYLNLRPVLAVLAKNANLVGYYDSDEDQNDPGKARSTWVVMARKREYLAKLRLEEYLDADELARTLRERYRERGEAAKLEKLSNLEKTLQSLLDRGSLPLLLKIERRPAPVTLTPQQHAVFREVEEDLDRILSHTWWKLRPRANVGLWTDDYSNLLSVFSW